jgi:hypothetical protein
MLKLWFGVAAALGVCLSAQVFSQEKVDLSVVQKIRHEAFGENSKVMDSAFYMTDVSGPRLTGSPNAKAAGGVGREEVPGMGTRQRQNGNVGTVRAGLELHAVHRHDEGTRVSADHRFRAAVVARD